MERGQEAEAGRGDGPSWACCSQTRPLPPAAGHRDAEDLPSGLHMCPPRRALKSLPESKEKVSYASPWEE